MAILKPVTTPAGVLVSFHKVMRASVDYESLTLSVVVSSWLDSAGYLEGTHPTWSWAEKLSPDVNNMDVDQALILSGRFAYGVVVADPSTDLASQKQHKWARVKVERYNRLTAPLTTPYGVFDADPESQFNLIKTILMLQTLAAAGMTTATADYTLYDNSVVTLDVISAVNVGLLLGEREGIVRAEATAMRGEIDSATTIEEVQAVEWVT